MRLRNALLAAGGAGAVVFGFSLGLETYGDNVAHSQEYAKRIGNCLIKDRRSVEVTQDQMACLESTTAPGAKIPETIVIKPGDPRIRLEAYQAEQTTYRTSFAAVEEAAINGVLPGAILGAAIGEAGFTGMYLLGLSALGSKEMETLLR